MESPVVAPLISIFVRKSVDDHRVTFSVNICIIHTNGFNANQQLSYAYDYYVVLWYWHVKKWSRNKYFTMASNNSIIRVLGIIQIISINSYQETHYRRIFIHDFHTYWIFPCQTVQTSICFAVFPNL